MCLKYKTIRVDFDAIELLYRTKTVPKADYEELVDKAFKPCNNSDLNEIKLCKSCDGKEKVIAKKSKIEDEVDFFVFFVPMKALNNYHFYVALANSKYRRFDKNDNTEYCPKPIVFMTAFNVFKDFHYYFKNENDKDENEIYKSINVDFVNRTKYFTIDKRLGFLDNSIWHFYVPFQNYKYYKNKKNKEVGFRRRLFEAVNVIKRKKELQLYDAIVAKENLEFQIRLMKNSYIDELDKKYGHSKHITPFIFHSEGEMYHKANYEIERLEKFNFSKEIKWRILLLDDHATKNVNGAEITKKEIVENITDEIKSQFKIKIFMDIVPISVEGNILDNFENEIEKEDKQYDIILLDYLLSDRQNDESVGSSSTEVENRIFGSELFTNPKYRNLLKEKYKGVLGKYWFLPISSFNKAMLDRITNKGIDRVTENWYIFDGADVINTPELFKYNLVKLMGLQLSQAIVTKKDIIDDLLNSKSSFKTIANVREKARGIYGSFMLKFGLLEFLKLDVENGSSFAKSILKLRKVEDHRQAAEFYEYVRQAFYLTGFGTYNDKSTIWELLKTIEKLLPQDEEKKIYKKDELRIFFSDFISYLNQK